MPGFVQVEPVTDSESESKAGRGAILRAAWARGGERHRARIKDTTRMGRGARRAGLCRITAREVAQGTSPTLHHIRAEALPRPDTRRRTGRPLGSVGAAGTNTVTKMAC
ncbi:hypothetical protein EVAR_99800_1 [Eumeta japonica]|uniref:Uncharacterized protein n=1 Tax=Eumeta variegata TaxID=151549 RepID=A0A4C1ZCZ4_EUMVA|nr:hypothetical protein EVAR_99800_1 [Eumeta japonica]